MERIWENLSFHRGYNRVWTLDAKHFVDVMWDAKDDDYYSVVGLCSMTILHHIARNDAREFSTVLISLRFNMP